jgi:hypothetical protein
VNIRKVLSLGVMSVVFCLGAAAQTRPPIVIETHGPLTVAAGNNLYCAGYIQTSGISDSNQIIGATDEADKYNYAHNDFMYINMGANKGVGVGDIFAVVRPHAQVKSKWSHKDDLGFYVQELGALEVVSVKANYSVARVKVSCDSFLLGDLVQLVEQRSSPIFEPRPPLDLFADPSGKATGRILMSRDGAEVLTRDYIAYVDLGADNNVKIGDRLTIFRPLGKGNPYNPPDNEAATARDYGFDSEKYKGGKFSNQAPRKSGSHAGGHEMAIDEVKSGRPAGLRKITGEAVVLNVKEKTATVVITRTASEIHTGDYVELQ